MSDRTTEFDLEVVQEAISVAGVDAWLFAQFHGRDPLATRVLGLPTHGLQTRRWYYIIPAQGEPRGTGRPPRKPSALPNLAGAGCRARRAAGRRRPGSDAVLAAEPGSVRGDG